MSYAEKLRIYTAYDELLLKIRFDYICYMLVTFHCTCDMDQSALSPHRGRQCNDSYSIYKKSDTHIEVSLDQPRN